MTEDQEKLHEEWRKQYLEREKERRKAANSLFNRIRNLLCPKKFPADLEKILSGRGYVRKKPLREYSRGELDEYYQWLADYDPNGDTDDEKPRKMEKRRLHS